MKLSEWLGGIRQLEGYAGGGGRVSECVCDSMKTLYLLVEETEIVRLVGGTYASYSQGKAEWKSSFSV